MKWFEVRDGDPRAVGIFERHYSCYKPKNGRKIDRVRYGFSGNGESLVLLTQDCRALFCWRKVVEVGINCSVFRNEGAFKSSALIQEACELAWMKWPGERLYTFVNSKKIRSSNPGYCFKMAGWNFWGMSKGGLHIFEKMGLTVERGENETVNL